MIVVETQMWKINTEDHDRLVALMAGGDGGNTGITFQKEHPEIFRYSLTHTFFTVDEETGEETWFIFDQYPDEDAYEQRWDRMVELTGTDSASFIEQVQSIQIPGSYRSHTVYREIPELTNYIS